MFQICQTPFSVETSITDFKVAWSERKSLVRAQITNHLDFQVSSLLQKCSRHCILKDNILDFTKFSFSPAADHWCTDTKLSDDCWYSYVLWCFQMRETSTYPWDMLIIMPEMQAVFFYCLQKSMPNLCQWFFPLQPLAIWKRFQDKNDNASENEPWQQYNEMCGREHSMCRLWKKILFHLQSCKMWYWTKDFQYK